MDGLPDLRLLTRRTIIDMARRRQRPGAGSSRDFLFARTAFVNWPDLTPVLSPIPWAVVDEPALAAVRDAFRRYAPDDLEDLESLIMLGKLEIESAV